MDNRGAGPGDRYGPRVRCRIVVDVEALRERSLALRQAQGLVQRAAGWLPPARLHEGVDDAVGAFQVELGHQLGLLAQALREQAGAVSAVATGYQQAECAATAPGGPR